MSTPAHRRPGPRYANEAGPQHVGRRVSIRHLIDDAGNERPTDVVGVLRQWTPQGQVEVERRDGSVARLTAAAIVASRLLPDAPPRRRR